MMFVLILAVFVVYYVYVYRMIPLGVFLLLNMWPLLLIVFVVYCIYVYRV